MRFRTAVPSIAVTALLAAGAAAQDCPELVGQWPHQTTSLVTRAGSYAYVAHDASLTVMDISDPQSPVACHRRPDQ